MNVVQTIYSLTSTLILDELAFDGLTIIAFVSNPLAYRAISGHNKNEKKYRGDWCRFHGHGHGIKSAKKKDSMSPFAIFELTSKPKLERTD